jgi:LPXTG-motif cell wall-anchored protein
LDSYLDTTFDFTIKLTVPDKTKATGNVPYEDAVPEVMIATTDASGAVVETKQAPADVVWTAGTGENVGTYTFKLKHNQTVLLRLPVGATYELKENADGYIAQVTVKDESGNEITERTTGFKIYSDEVKGNIYLQNGENDTTNKGNQTVTITNTPGDALPLVGGIGTLPFTLAGLMGIGAGGAGLLLKKKKKEDEDDMEETEKD